MIYGPKVPQYFFVVILRAFGEESAFVKSLGAKVPKFVIALILRTDHTEGAVMN
jgi:hypothetical protein